MSQMKVSGFTNPGSGTAATQVNFGFQVDSITLTNSTTGVVSAWNSSMVDGSYSIVDKGTYTSTNGFSPLAQNASYGANISAFSNANPGVITVDNTATFGFAAGDTIEVSEVADNLTGALSLNGAFKIASVTATTITTTANTSVTGYSVYVSGGVVIRKLDANGKPVPTENFAIEGLTFGTGVVGVDDDVITYVAFGSNSVI